MDLSIYPIIERCHNFDLYIDRVQPFLHFDAEIIRVHANRFLESRFLSSEDMDIVWIIVDSTDF